MSPKAHFAGRSSVIHNGFMRINMNHLPVGSICQMEEFLKSNGEIAMEITEDKEKYEFVKSVLFGIRYKKLKRIDKRTVQRYLRFLTGYSKGHIKTLISRWRNNVLYFNPARKRNTFPVKYFAEDIQRLIDTDTIHGCLNGKTTKEIMRREAEVFGKTEYENISKISVSHLYNIRNYNLQYGSSPTLFFKHTEKTAVDIGVRRKPAPYGKPGYLRVDTVHQGDLDGVKGVYHINIVDEITQYEMIATVKGIGYSFLKPVLKELLSLFPFKIYEFHSDNGSEYINRIVAELLTNLFIEQSKSRARHSNDNALVESKNGSVVRKLFGRNFIDRKFAPLINAFNKEHVNMYLNYHRPCLFSEDKIDTKGKIRKNYKIVMTPYEKLKSLESFAKYLKPEAGLEHLDKLAYAESDNDFGKKLMKAREALFKKIKHDLTK
jgi:transposase InsO family protein